MTIGQQVAGGVVWSGVQAVLGRGVSFVVFLVLARLLSPDAFGLVAMVAVIISVLDVFVDQGIGTAIVQRLEVDPGFLSTAWWLNFIAGSVLSGCLFFSAPLVAQVYSEPKLVGVTRGLAMLLCIQAASVVPRAILTRAFRFKEAVFGQVVNAIISGVAGIACAQRGLGAWSLVVQQLVAATLDLAFFTWRSGFVPRFVWFAADARAIYKFGWGLIASGVLGQLSRRADDALIGAYLGRASLGVYAVGYRLLTVTSQIVTKTITRPIVVGMSRLQSSVDGVNSALLRSVRLGSMLTLPLFGALFVCSQELVVFLFGAQWAQSGRVLTALCVAGAAESITHHHFALYVALGRLPLQFRIMLIRAVANVVGFYAVVAYGVVAVAWVVAVVSSAMVVVEVVLIHRATGLSLVRWMREVAGPLGGTLAGAGAGNFARLTMIEAQLPGLAAAMAGVVVFVVIFFGVVWAASRDTVRELRSRLLALARSRAAS